MPYPPQRGAPRRHFASAELLYLCIVLAAGLSTAWWASHTIGLDLSAITSVASAVGLRDSARVTRTRVGHVAPLSTSNVGPAADQPAGTDRPQECTAGAAPTLPADAATLARHLGPAMGTPLECVHPADGGADLVQQTSAGLIAYRAATRTWSFTDGWRHYAATPGGYTTWEGAASDPPPGSVVE